MSTDICRWLFLLFFLTTWTSFTNSKEIRVVCYYTNWSVYRPGTAKFSPQNINPYLCTHLIYAFGGFTKENTLKPFDKYQDIEKGGYAKFTGLKTYNKNLKTMLAIGGWNEGSSRFSPMVANAERRRELIRNTVKFLRQNHFDGLDLDWEYPSFRDGGKSRDRDNYAQLVQELREEFEKESEKTGRPRLLLTMAVPAGIEYINKGYDVPKLTKYLDWMNILSYDYHSAFEPAVNHHAPLFSLEEPSEYNYDTELNIDYTIQHYLELGADPNKLVMGIPTYGRSYTLFNPDANEIGAPADGPGDMGDATRENGYLAYYEICENIKSQDWEVVQPNPDAMGPYAYKDNQWVGYDDDAIARKKAVYVAEHGLGGIMFWSIDNDDFRGNCHGKPYPIIEAAKEALISAHGLTDENLVSPRAKPIKSKTRTRTQSPKLSSDSKDDSGNKKRISTSGGSRRRNRVKTKSNESVSESRPKIRRKESRRTTEAAIYSSLELVTPSYTTPAPPPTPDQGGVFKCEDEGFYPHPKDCKKYFWCLSGPGELGIIAHQFTCPAGLYFNKAADSCDYTRNVLCNKKLPKATTTTTTTEASTSKTPTTSTKRAPPKITAATSRTTQFRTSTTTEAYEDEYEEYEDEEELEDTRNLEEDPKVIKELLDLIKKAGGIEQLEKQLNIHEDGSASVSHPDATTPSSISKSLVEKVLGKAAKNNNGRKTSYNFLNRNSRGPQNEGLSKSDEPQKQERSRPQYTTITRQRSQKTTTADDDENSDINNTDVLLKPVKKQPEYVNIRRGRVSSTTEEPEEDLKGQLNRNKILGEDDEDVEYYDDDDDDDEEEINEEKSTTRRTVSPQYVNIRRQRPSTTETTSTSKYTVIRRGSTTESAIEEANEDSKSKRRGTTTTATDDKGSEDKISGSTTPLSKESSSKPKYKILRRGSTTQSPEESIPADNEDETQVKSKKRGTTTPSSEDISAGKTRGTTVPSASSDLKTKYKGIKRGSTTETTTATEVTSTIEASTEESKHSPTTSPTSSTTEVSNEAATSSDTENPAAITDQLLITTPESLSIKTTASLSTTTVLTEQPKVGFKLSESSDSDDGVTQTSTSEKRPLLLEPRPFSLSTSGPTSSIKPVTESSTRITKSGRVTTPFLFRVGGRRKTSPALTTVTTTTPKPSSRPTKITRRKYPLQNTKPLESQESTTKALKVTDNRYKFVSRKPFFRTTTVRNKADTEETADQIKESSNQQSLEENFEKNDTTELGDIALVLHEIQQAPVPTKTSTTTRISPQRIKPTRGPTRSKIRYSTTSPPIPLTTKKFIVRRVKPQAFERINPTSSNTFRPLAEYDYYDEDQMSILGKIPEHSKVLLHSNGVIECLDQGNFPHPVSCKKFISCAKMENGKVLGWEYTCPKNLSFDPIGGICNWSAGLGCNE